MHRVWVIKGELKPDQYHPYKTRVLYLDEDSWLAIMAENYDKNGKLWRVSLSYTNVMPELPGVFKVADVFHDLRNKAYYIQAVESKAGKSMDVSTSMPSKAEFMPSSLRRKGFR